MKIVCVSDLHSNLVPSKDMPEGDLLLIAGDNPPTSSHDVGFQVQWMNAVFNGWINSIESKYKRVIFISGNHCFWAEEKRWAVKIENALYLQDEYCIVEGLKIWGFPHSLPFYDWAFNTPEEELEQIYSKVDKADIILSHGPPYGYGDKVVRYVAAKPVYENAGSKALLNLIDRVKPKLVCVGHLHENYGIYKRGETVIVNASLLNDQYKMVNKPIVVEI